MKTVTLKFESVSAMIEYASKPIPKRASVAAKSLIGRTNGAHAFSTHWYGIESATNEAPIPYASRLFSEGWPEGVRKLQEAINGLFDIAPPESSLRRLTWGDGGDSIDMNKVYCGQLDTAWRRAKRRTTRAPAPLTIWIPFSMPQNLDAETLFWPGAAVSALADALGAAGYSVGINAYNQGFCNVTGNEPVKMDLVCCIKPQGSPMDLSTLAAATALPSMIRGCCFSAMTIGITEQGHCVQKGLAGSDRSNYEGMEPGDICDLFDITNATKAAYWVERQINEITRNQAEKRDA